MRAPTIRECREGSAYWDDDQMELLVSYHYHEWSEGHPYGSTTAYERMADANPIDYQLNGECITYEALVEQFVKEFVDARINEAMEAGS